jgi:hypothetical protein
MHVVAMCVPTSPLPGGSPLSPPAFLYASTLLWTSNFLFSIHKCLLNNPNPPLSHSCALANGSLVLLLRMFLQFSGTSQTELLSNFAKRDGLEKNIPSKELSGMHAECWSPSRVSLPPCANVARMFPTNMYMYILHKNVNVYKILTNAHTHTHTHTDFPACSSSLCWHLGCPCL